MLDLKGRTRSDDRNHAAMSDRANGLPTVSVVAVAREDADVTIRELTARYGRWAQFGVELIVVCGGDTTWNQPVSALHPIVRVIYGPADASDAQLRSIGLAGAEGDLVMLVDDAATADEEWLAHLRGTRARPIETTRA